MRYTFYYRNYLKSCNYRCEYCPFPKEHPSEKMVERDKKYLNKFVDFIKNSEDEFSIFFAPRGEALVFDYYRKALIELSHLENVREVVMQTNLSCSLDWLKKVNVNKLILWTTYHPKEVEFSNFLKQVKVLMDYNIRFTVGTVGVKEVFGNIKEMKLALKELGDNSPYMWINAYKDVKDYYNTEDVEFLTECDPLFEINKRDYECNGEECKTGETVFFMEWNGNIHRCWQDKRKIGNIYSNKLEDISLKRTCKKDICGCFIGYSNMKSLELNKVYKDSLLGRIP